VRHDRGGEWVRFWRSPDGRVEAMHAHFRRHAYHRHSHETYSFGVTESGAQSFTCRGARRTSAAGMVMAFNPDDPHDGHATDEEGFTYRMVHVSPALVGDVLADAGRTPSLPLFAEPVIDEARLARSLRRLHTALWQGTALERDELLTSTLLALAQRGGRALRAGAGVRLGRPGAAQLADRVRALLDEAYAEQVSAADLEDAAGCSRYVLFRAFQAMFGLAPSEYQRQVRLRRARRLLACGGRPADVATAVGFADQAHLTRWFVRSFGMTPGAYVRA
jgi:AraC-like DNA-binding protein